MARVKRGVSDVSTAQKVRLRSKPRAAGSRLLELYLLTKERDRLEQHKEVVDKKNRQVDEGIENVEEEMEKIAGNKPLYELTREPKKSRKKGGKDKRDRVKTNKITLDY
ncbi:MAG: hypothetical protein KKH73_03610 [Actinobacteria bacterium]|nr:hypothetical protein [Actinomycetota bacterium]MBU4241036.1 hypothetical protein [Actinomycetota bacterium]MBU4386062.1 hypothetical protein [Actinomycetota bacterium]